MKRMTLDEFFVMVAFLIGLGCTVFTILYFSIGRTYKEGVIDTMRAGEAAGVVVVEVVDYDIVYRWRELHKVEDDTTIEGEYNESN